MESELLPQCGACGSRGTHKVGAETAAPAVGCHCGVIVTGFTEAEATERWERLARRAEIGALVERFSTALTLGDETGCDETMAGQDIDEVEPVVVFGAHAGGKHGQGATLLEALRALAAELEVIGE